MLRTVYVSTVLYTVYVSIVCYVYSVMLTVCVLWVVLFFCDQISPVSFLFGFRWFSSVGLLLPKSSGLFGVLRATGGC